jgi:hypothetical protein
MYEEVGDSGRSRFYSDITQAGGLGRAVQAQLMAIGSPLRVKKAEPGFTGLLPFDWEVVEQKRRFSQIRMAKHQRLFLLDFWDHGVCLAHGSTPSLSTVAEVIHYWLAEAVSTGELRSQFPFVVVKYAAESHEEGADAEVERQWQAVYDRVKSVAFMAALAPLVEKAMGVPVLRQLFPFTSLNRLCFSRCTGYPYSGDCPSVWPTRWREPPGPPESYTVGDPKGNVLGQGDASEAVELIVRHLPPNCGPAIQGTADD